MRPEMVVPGAGGGEVFLEIVGDSRLEKPGEDLLFESEEEAFDAAVLPGAVRGGTLVANSEQPKRESEEARGEDPFVVGAQGLGLSKAIDHVEENPQGADAGTIAKLAEREAEASAVIDEAQDGPRLLGPEEKGEIERPDEVLRQSPRFPMLELSPRAPKRLAWRLWYDFLRITPAGTAWLRATE